MSGSLSIRNNHLYYVDATGGDDNNSGHHADDAWQTIAKVNASTFQPGDMILFKRGETWAGTQLTVSGSGASGMPITFSDYGSGDLPQITGPDTATQTIYSSGKNYLAFSNLEIVGSASSNHCLRIQDGGHDITIANCIIHDAGLLYGISVRGVASDTYNLRITGCTVYGCDENGIAVSNPTGYSDIPTDVEIDNNIVYSNGTSTASDHGIYCNFDTGSVHDNICYDNAGAGIKLNSARDVIVERNVSYSTTLGAQQYGFFMDKEADPAANSGNILRNNVVYNTVFGMWINPIATANYYYHNTFVNLSNAGKTNGYGIRFSDGTSNQVFKNNIIYQDSAVVGTFKAAYRIITAGDEANNTFDYNCVRCEDTLRFAEVGASLYTFAEWQALTGSPDANSLNSDPVFVTEYTNLHLQSSSPCRNAGEDLDVADDYDGVARDDTPDIGAYEYVA